MTKKIAALLMAIVFIFNLAACSGGGDTASTPTDDPSSSEGQTSSDGNGSGLSPQGGIGGDLGGTKTEAPEEPATDSLFGKPDNYIIVYPGGNEAMRKQAVRIQRWFSDTYRCTLPVVTDGNAETKLEILVGKTSRKESDKSIADGAYKVSVQGQKLVFDGSHAAMIELATQKFVELNPKKNSDVKISGKIKDFKPTMLGKYDYVWGDEFETDEVDFTKWTFEAKMGAYADASIATDRDVIDMKNGKLILRSTVLNDPAHPKINYKMPTSVVTQRNMMFTYGYCEIKAKVPCARGTWPSFWIQTNTGIGERKCFDYFVEVDIFEVFGTTNGNVVPNLHKWYTKDAGGHHVVTGAKNSVTLGSKAGEYHTYGYEWTPTEMSMYVDGVKYETYDITDPSIIKNNPDNDMRGFHDPQFIIFNNHLFTDQANYQPGGDENLIENNKDSLPSEYSIEYFRLYQKKGEGKLWTDERVYKTFTGR